MVLTISLLLLEISWVTSLSNDSCVAREFSKMPLLQIIATTCRTCSFTYFWMLRRETKTNFTSTHTIDVKLIFHYFIAYMYVTQNLLVVMHDKEISSFCCIILPLYIYSQAKIVRLFFLWSKLNILSSPHKVLKICFHSIWGLRDAFLVLFISQRATLAVNV